MSNDQIGPGEGDPIPDVVEPITGYRGWSWDVRGLSSYNGQRWIPGVNKAECHAGGRGLMPTYARLGLIFDGQPAEEPTHEHTIPSHPDDTARHGQHGCGIYAYRTLEDCWRDRGYPGFRSVSSEMTGTVFGEVEMWGLVWPHAKGFRSEYARVKTLYRFGDEQTIFGNVLDALTTMYGVEVVDMPLDEEKRTSLIDERIAERQYALTSFVTSGWSHMGGGVYSYDIPADAPVTKSSWSIKRWMGRP